MQSITQRARALQIDEKLIQHAIAEFSQLPAALQNGLQFTHQMQMKLADHAVNARAQQFYADNPEMRPL